MRGNRQNYDDWAAEGCEGWSFDEVLPLFKRLENYEGGASDLRGVSGPIEVTHPAEMSPVSRLFGDAVADTCDVPLVADYNGPRQESVGPVQMSAKKGLRSSTSGAICPRYLAEWACQE